MGNAGNKVVIIILIIILIVNVMKKMTRKINEKNKREKTEAYVNRYSKTYIEEAICDIEKAYEIITVYPPGKPFSLSNEIFFGITVDEKHINPEYKIAMLCPCEYTLQNHAKWMEDKNRGKHYPMWRFKEWERYNSKTNVMSEVALITETEGVTWDCLKEGVVSDLKGRKPNWKFEVSDSCVYIKTGDGF